MQTIHSVLFVLHILFGSMALILFWIPMVSKKGSLDHQRFGKYYANTMYVVAATGALMALLVIALPLQIKGHLYKDENPEVFIENIRRFWLFLLYLSLLTYASVLQGMQSLTHKTNTKVMRTKINVVTQATQFFAGIALLVMGVAHSHTLYIVFGMLGTATGLQTLRYLYAKQLQNKQWLVEHLSNMISSGIGAYTAFIAFGGRQIFADIGQWQYLFWIAPGVIGGIAIGIYAQQYKSQMVKVNQQQVR